MKQKPKGPKFRNLVARGGVIYYRRVIGGRPVRVSCETDDWERAARRRDLFETQRGIGRLPVPILESPTFGELANRYLDEATAHLAATTRSDHERLLAPENVEPAGPGQRAKPRGRLLGYFGATRIHEITRARLVEWWQREAAGLSSKTGKNYVDALASVLGYAVDLELLDSNPVSALRETLRRRGRTKRGRAESDASHHAHPVEPAAALEKLLAAARGEGLEAAGFVLLQLDAGLRQGEALGLRWDRVAWGSGTGDVWRHLLIDGNRPRGGRMDATKSGRARRVALSRRLRATLRELYVAQGSPAGAVLVFPDLDPNNFRHRGWERILKRAGVGAARMKDLRDSFASYLLTAGVQLGYVSEQLGHADVAITAKHYARWVGGHAYRAPLELRSGEVPADLLARLEVVTKWSQSRAARKHEAPGTFVIPRA